MFTVWLKAELCVDKRDNYLLFSHLGLLTPIPDDDIEALRGPQLRNDKREPQLQVGAGERKVERLGMQPIIPVTRGAKTGDVQV